MKEYSFDRSFGSSASAVQPNFDDERTVLSARPVVPLEKINAKERHRRHWILGGAFAIAMMLGAASALLASYLKLRNAPSAVSEISEVESPSTPVASANTVANELPVAENAAEVENTEELIAPVTSTKPKRKAIVRHNSDFTPAREVREINEEDELQRIREAVLFDAWQERRARRAARRERRSRVDHHDRDLSNLDEIFEGRPRKP